MIINRLPRKIGGGLEFGIYPITQAQYEAGISGAESWGVGAEFQFIGIINDAIMTSDCWIGTEATINGNSGYLRVYKDDYAPDQTKKMCVALYQSRDNYNDPYFKEYFTGYACVVLPDKVTVANPDRGMWTGTQIYITNTDIRQ